MTKISSNTNTEQLFATKDGGEKASTSLNEAKIIQTDVGSKDGQDKCPKCGSTEIETNINSGKLRCHFCRFEFTPKKIEGFADNISNLKGKIIGSGAQNIIEDTKDIITFKCSSCAAEVVIDTLSSTQARCHWCRNTLSINQQIPNGAIPDVVLPFSITKEQAKMQIQNFVEKRSFFAHPKFKKEFTTINIMGVFLPYMIVDINANSTLTGQGEKLTRKYTIGSGDNKTTYYDADVFNVSRKFDLIVNGLTVESSADKANNQATDKTNNVINSIMPFDIEKCVKWNANYLRGYTSEKRDVNIDQLKGLVTTQVKDISRFQANETIKEYDRGVAWSNENLDIKGQRWKAAYLPVWLYSYQQVKGDKKLLHYVAVNGRTKETMGSVPIHMPKLLGFSLLVQMIGLFFAGVIFIDQDFGWLFILSGIIFFIVNMVRYRNSNARHYHEKETTSNISNIQKQDAFIKKRTRLKSPIIEGANNNSVSGIKVSVYHRMYNKYAYNRGLDNNKKEGKKGELK